MSVSRILLVFLISFLTAGITIARETLSHFGFDTNYLLVALIAIVIAGLLSYRELFLVVLVCSISVAINLPFDFLAQQQINREILVGVLIAIIFLPVIKRMLGY